MDHTSNQDLLFKLLLKSLEANSALQSRNETLQNIIELMPGNVYWKNLEGTILGVNNNLAKISGKQSPADMIGKTILELFGQSFADYAQKYDQIVYELGKEYSHEEAGLTLDNKPAVYISKKIPLYDSSGKLNGTLGVSVDITDRKKMEEELLIAKEKAEISNRVKSQFVAAVNHELRTPLASIIGLVDLLKAETVNEQENKKIIASIENCAQHLLNLVNDVLDFSKLETGRQQIKITPIQFRLLLSEVHELLNPLAKNKNLPLFLVTDTQLPLFLLSDIRILRHILINLISNAIKYTEKGEIIVKIEILKQTAERVQLKISICDTGLGIPEDKLNIIFKPFQQLNTATTRNSSRNGTGLGLTIVKKLAEAIDATLEVESQLGKGSTFSMTAEFAIPDEKTLRAHQKSLPEFQKNHEKKTRVLVVEDDVIIQYIHEKLLTTLSCEVDVASNANDAMNRLKEHHDIIFLDMSLPDLTGYELIKKIRQTTSIHCPIVIISAFLDKEEEMACLEAGANDFVSKPISQAKFKELLARHCSVSETTHIG